MMFQSTDKDVTIVFTESRINKFGARKRGLTGDGATIIDTNSFLPEFLFIKRTAFSFGYQILR